MDTPKSIGNINFLNLVDATPESVAAIGQIENVNLALYTPQTAALFQGLDIHNINATIEIPGGASLVMDTGTVVINAAFFKGIAKKIYLMVTGQLIVEPGVPVEEVQQGLAGIAVTGQFLCPENLMGTFHTVPNTVVGQTVAYPPFKHFFKGDLALDAGFLESLEDGAELCVIGSLSAPKVLPNDLLERKIGRIFVNGGTKCHAENAQALRARLHQPGGGFETIPAGFEWVQKVLLLDGETLEYLPGKKLYCPEQVRVAADVDAEQLDRQLEQLIAGDLLLCPAALKPILARKCSLFDTKAIFYADELWLVQDEQTWAARRFEGLQGTATLVVTGELTIDPGVPADALAARISKVHNFGLIRCLPEQQAALEARLVTREGQIESSRDEEPQVMEARPNFIANINLLNL